MEAQYQQPKACRQAKAKGDEVKQNKQVLPVKNEQPVAPTSQEVPSKPAQLGHR